MTSEVINLPAVVPGTDVAVVPAERAVTMVVRDARPPAERIATEAEARKVDPDRMTLEQAERYVRRLRRVRFSLFCGSSLYLTNIEQDFVGVVTGGNWLAVSAAQVMEHLGALKRRDPGRTRYVRVTTHRHGDWSNVYVG
jgi:hypothetical protein